MATEIQKTKANFDSEICRLIEIAEKNIKRFPNGRTEAKFVCIKEMLIVMREVLKWY